MINKDFMFERVSFECIRVVGEVNYMRRIQGYGRLGEVGEYFNVFIWGFSFDIGLKCQRIGNVVNIGNILDLVFVGFKQRVSIDEVRVVGWFKYVEQD